MYIFQQEKHIFLWTIYFCCKHKGLFRFRSNSLMPVFIRIKYMYFSLSLLLQFMWITWKLVQYNFFVSSSTQCTWKLWNISLWCLWLYFTKCLAWFHCGKKKIELKCLEFKVNEPAIDSLSANVVVRTHKGSFTDRKGRQH